MRKAGSSARRLPKLCTAHQPWWSMNCLRSSIGGCAPYSSTSGMFRSSTKMTWFFPTGGPNTPLRRLSSFPSMMSCRHAGM